MSKSDLRALLASAPRPSPPAPAAPAQTPPRAPAPSVTPAPAAPAAAAAPRAPTPEVRPVTPARDEPTAAAPRFEGDLLVLASGSQDMETILLDMGVKPSHVHVALRRAAQSKEPLAQVMRDFGFLSGEGVALAVSRQSGLPYFPAEAVDHVDKRSFEGVELPEFRRYVPVGKDSEGKLLVAVPDVSLRNEALNAYYSQAARAVVASEHTIQTVYRRFFANTEAAFDAAVSKFTQSTRVGRKDEDERSVGLVREVYFALLRHACYAGASDLYLHRSDFVGIVRLKVNGVGQIFRTISLELYNRLLNKLVQDNAKADDLRSKPREAIVEFSEEDRRDYPDLATRFNFRLELTESRGIRSGVIRVLDRSAAATDLGRLGFDPDTLKAINRISRTATGFFLVTGPTGSGKTTSLYAILKNIDAVERSVQSIENPIEYEHGLWLQFEPRRDSTDEGEAFNDWLKALLRNAPDVILVGEVRDKGVANICLNAANTGHLVFATLHTNDAVMAVARLKALDVDMDVLGSVLLGILAQRLLRTLCDCKVPDTSPETKEMLEAPYLRNHIGKVFKAGSGCVKCDYTGYRGRRMIYELLQVNGEVRAILEANGSPSAIAAKGMPTDKTMWASGLRLVAGGLTSADELLRVAKRYD